jgi:hypothetical protein
MPDRDVATDSRGERVPAGVAGAGAVPRDVGDSSAPRETEPTATRSTEEPSRFRRFFSRR